jgi:8-oxo-dGTP diphosphatase
MSDSDLPTNNASQTPLNDLWVVAAVIRHENLVFAAKRKAGGGSGLKWEFPGGKVEDGETAVEALKREIQEELAIEIEVNKCIGTFSTPLGTNVIHLECYWCHSSSKDVVLNSHEEAGWFNAYELEKLDWALPDLPVVSEVFKTI